jgi:hypothetical protein
MNTTKSNAALTETEILTASQYVQGVNEMIAAKTLFVRGVQIKAIHRANYKSIFAPGVDDLVRRFLGWPAITC